MEETKLSLFVIFRGSSLCVGDFIYTEKEGKTTLAHCKNIFIIVIFGQACMKYFKKGVVNMHIDNVIAESLVTELMVEEPTENESTVGEYTFNECRVQEFLVPKKGLLNKDGNSFHCSIELF